jgi:hypothetical protein
LHDFDIRKKSQKESVQGFFPAAIRQAYQFLSLLSPAMDCRVATIAVLQRNQQQFEAHERRFGSFDFVNELHFKSVKKPGHESRELMPFRVSLKCFGILPSIRLQSLITHLPGDTTELIRTSSGMQNPRADRS